MTSKYLFVFAVKLYLQIYKANLNGLSSVSEMVESVGTTFFVFSVVMVNELRSRVFMIMLANPIIIVMMIARETTPPVIVLNYRSSS